MKKSELRKIIRELIKERKTEDDRRWKWCMTKPCCIADMNSQCCRRLCFGDTHAMGKDARLEEEEVQSPIRVPSFPCPRGQNWFQDGPNYGDGFCHEGTMLDGGDVHGKPTTGKNKRKFSRNPKRGQ